MNDTTNSNTLDFTFKFVFDDKSEKVFDVHIEPKTLSLLRSDDSTPPEWTKLDNFKCSHCPLNSDEFKYCPVAVNLKDIINFFSDTPSYEKVNIEVVAEERTYKKYTSIQSGVSSLIGVLMVTSGCPVMGKLKPLIRFHLPFASIEETEFRAFAFYLIKQFIKLKKGDEPDWSMKGLVKIYEDIHKLNQNVCEKIADLEAQDASINAVVVLNNFADSVTFTIDEDDIAHLEELFKDFA
ncbi:MAG: hypothetical protein K9J16_04525 [Melioribacteraceae bacterium]|nr:hypothetical protein [Melioribacteraceae bacterium]MCF8354744.1 hypothetical protein [Melioribacteraceae bacterium]MCF8393234.1 hypothetical protein [Melioribacteraceae bacterium]MCF8417535.1 hypothetical protein [Melioribacteraceae bacterium]